MLRVGSIRDCCQLTLPGPGFFSEDKDRGGDRFYPPHLISPKIMLGTKYSVDIYRMTVRPKKWQQKLSIICIVPIV